MKVIKENKFTVFVIVIYILVIIAGYVIYTSGNDQELNYGDRLDGIEKVPISDEQYDTLVRKLTEEKIVKDASYHLSGKTLNVILTVLENTSVADAKKVGATVPSYLTKEQLEFYDVQVFIKEDALVFKTGMSLEEFASLLQITKDKVVKTLEELKITVNDQYVLSFKDAEKVAKKLEKKIKDEDDAHFPIIGYLKVGSKMTWTKDR